MGTEEHDPSRYGWDNADDLEIELPKPKPKKPAKPKPGKKD